MKFTIIHPATVETIKFCVNLVVRAAVLALTWACILAIGVGFNWLINWILKALMAPEIIGRYSEQVVFLYVLILGIAATATSFKDIFALIRASMRNAPSSSAINPARADKNAEERASSD